MGVWYYGVRGQQLGPIEEAQLRSMLASGQLTPEDMVWTEGMPGWAPARQALGGPPPIMAQAVMPVAGAGPYAAGMPGIAPHYAGVVPGPGGPIQLQYAAPVVNPLPVIPHDDGPFFKVGSYFTVPGSKRWIGVSVVSPRAFYLLKIRRQQSGAAYGIGGIGAMLIASAFTTADDTRTCDLNDVPYPVRMALDPKSKRKAGDVIILPKGAIRFIKPGGGLNATIAVHVGGEKFIVNRGLFSGGAVRQFLTGTGWALNQELVPTAPPMHGHGFGRPFSEIGKQGPGATKRILYGVFGVIIIIIYIIIRIAGH